MSEKLSLDNKKTLLFSESRVFKTERFIHETSRFKDLDLFISKLAEGVVSNAARFAAQKNEEKLACFMLQTEDKEHAFFFAFGRQLHISSSATGKDIVFFKYSSRENYIGKNDGRLARLLVQDRFSVFASPAALSQSEKDFFKLYRLSNSGPVNFPLLNDTQKRIVNIEDQNVLVQGVAGSGKTNVCIDKIVFTACRVYAGRVLYSTFSRGLLIDTQTKVKIFRDNLKKFIDDYENGSIVFLDTNHKKAVENKLGIYFSVEDDRISLKIKQIIKFLDENVDYFLLEDFYRTLVHLDKREKIPGGDERDIFADENFFLKKYVKDIKNHQLASKLEKVAYLSYEVIYKEIYGIILGCCDPAKPFATLTLNEYADKRRDSFTQPECEIIYSLAQDYDAYLKKNNLLDNNIISRILLKKTGDIKKYSLAIMDEVQDLTEISLYFLKSISRKLFCVGDALQMINPSYFGFAYLKRLLFEKDIVNVAELTNNYRNTKRIADLTDRLGQINIKQFGTHSFVLKGESIDSGVPTSAVYIRDGGFIDALERQSFSSYTVVVPNNEIKEFLRSVMPHPEILTVAEIKGLERETVVLYNVLSENLDKWKTLERTAVNRKQADENSVFRYYFNLFYVGVSRAKAHIYVAEDYEVTAFRDFFREGFDNLGSESAIAELAAASDKAETEQDELLERAAQFIALEQFDNARFTVAKIINESAKIELSNRIDIFERLVHHGRYREAGIRFWELGMTEDSKKQFSLSGDQILCDLIDACAGDGKELSVDILSFLPDIENNSAARSLILDVVKKDLRKVTDNQRKINSQLKKLKA